MGVIKNAKLVFYESTVVSETKVTPTHTDVRHQTLASGIQTPVPTESLVAPSCDTEEGCTEACGAPPPPTSENGTGPCIHAFKTSMYVLLNTAFSASLFSISRSSLAAICGNVI